MPSFGQKLKSEREKRAITLDQISSSTKIGTRMLQALEEENFDQLPGGIFNKGFVRAYARHVGLDEDQTIAGYLQASGQNDAVKPELEVPATPEQPREPSSWPIPWGALAAVLLLLAVVLSLWNRRQHKNESFSQAHVPIPAEEVIPTPSAKADLQQTVTPAKDVSPAPKPASATPDSVLAAPPTIATQTGEFTVAILASEDSWLSIVVDGKNVFQDVLLAENQRAVHGQKEVVIRAGNIGGLDFIFNGKKLASQGDYGEVKTLTFGSAGLQPNAPASSVTQQN